LNTIVAAIETVYVNVTLWPLKLFHSKKRTKSRLKRQVKTLYNKEQPGLLGPAKPTFSLSVVSSP